MLEYLYCSMKMLNRLLTLIDAEDSTYWSMLSLMLNLDLLMNVDCSISEVLLEFLLQEPQRSEQRVEFVFVKRSFSMTLVQ